MFTVQFPSNGRLFLLNYSASGRLFVPNCQRVCHHFLLWPVGQIFREWPVPAHLRLLSGLQPLLPFGWGPTPPQCPAAHFQQPDGKLGCSLQGLRFELVLPFLISSGCLVPRSVLPLLHTGCVHRLSLNVRPFGAPLATLSLVRRYFTPHSCFPCSCCRLLCGLRFHGPKGHFCQADTLTVSAILRAWLAISSHRKQSIIILKIVIMVYGTSIPLENSISLNSHITCASPMFSVTLLPTADVPLLLGARLCRLATIPCQPHSLTADWRLNCWPKIAIACLPCSSLATADFYC
jgi:hypothetical protein